MGLYVSNIRVIPIEGYTLVYPDWKLMCQLRATSFKQLSVLPAQHFLLLLICTTFFVYCRLCCIWLLVIELF
jgi:hypothetical protein